MLSSNSQTPPLPPTMLSQSIIVIIASFTGLGLIVVLTHVAVQIWNRWTIRRLRTPTPSEATGHHIPLQPVPVELTIIDIQRATIEEGDKVPEDWEIGQAV